MRARFLAAVFMVAVAGERLGAQTPVPTTSPSLPSPLVLADTVILSSFALANGATFASGPLTLNHVLIGGLTPSHYRVSRYPDFRDATWLAYAGNAPTWTGNAEQTGPCSSVQTLRFLAHFQVRARKTSASKTTSLTTPATYVQSNVRSDTTCLVISG